MKKISLFYLFYIVFAIHSNAQNCLISTGNSLSGSDGSLCCSVGQIVISSIQDGYSKLLHGIQQPYIDDMLSDITTVENCFLKDSDNPFDIRIFSVPSRSEGIIQLSNPEKGLSYNIYDINGVLIQKENIVNDKTRISLKPGFYIFTIMKNRNVILKSQMIKL